MNQTIDQSSPTVGKKKLYLNETFLLWSIILAGAIASEGLLMGIVKAQHGFFLSIYPWVNAGGHSINNGLTMFSGNTPQLPDTSEKLGYLISLLGVYILFPTLFFFGLRNRAGERISGVVSPVFRKSTIQFVLGGMVTLGAAMPSVPIAIIQHQVSNSLRGEQKIQADKDEMINEINKIAWKLCEYRVLPKDLKGGSGSFNGCTLSSEYTSTACGMYSLEIQDTMVVIKASAKHIVNASITTNLHRDFNLRDWSYIGEFE
jgi:hypothetical protein